MPILNTAEKKEDIQKLISNIVLEVLSYTAEKQRKDIQKAQREGIEQAKNKGIRFGRPPVKKPDEFAKYFKLLDGYKITATQMMKELNLRPNSFYKLLKNHLGPSQYNLWKKNRKHYKK